MKVRNANLKLRILSLAMIGVFSSMYAYADEEEAAALMYPQSTVEVEAISVSQSSQKFGEYNGLNKQGVVPNGNLNIRGGDAYKDNANGGTQRWNINGTNLGLSDRSANIGYSDQGNWGVSVGYDELTHNMTTGYMTPYQGSMGGNNFKLPAGFGAVNVTGTVAPYPGATVVLTPSQSNALNNNTVNISTTRQNTSFNATKVIDSSTNVVFDYNHLNQTGAKPMGFAAAGISYGVSNGQTGEKVSILPNPTNYQTDTVSAALNWQGEKARLTGSYFGSFFRDGFNGVQFQTWNGNQQTQTMSTAPSNQLQQLNLGGGYDFSNLTKLAGNLSWGRNTQNTSTTNSGMMTGAFPTAAFNGLVNTTHADLRLTDRTIKDLSLLASYKFDQRDNLTQSNLYSFNQINTTTNGSNAPYSPSTPLSFRNSQIDFGGEYKITKDQKASLNYTNLQTARWCNQYATGTYTTGIVPTAAPNIPYTYPAGADCVTANFSRSNAINAGYKIKASETVDVKVNYIYDIRKTTANQTAITGMDVSGSGGYNVNNAYGLPLGARMMYPGQNGGDYVGYQPFFEASRNQQTLKARSNWQAGEDLSFGLGGKYTYASYPDSTYGVQNSTAWNITLDSAYQYAEQGSVTAYAVQQNSQRNLSNYIYSASNVYPTPTANASVTSGTWNNNLQNHDTTFGLGIKHGGLMSGKLDLNSDLTYSLGQTFYNTTPGSYSFVGNGTTAGASGLNTGSFGAPPAIRNDMIGFRIGGVYKIDKSSKVGVQYLYQRLLSTDYYYNGYQQGTTPTSIMPSNQTSGSYAVNVITVGYTYSFD